MWKACHRTISISILFIVLLPASVRAQYDNKWLTPYFGINLEDTIPRIFPYTYDDHLYSYPSWHTTFSDDEGELRFYSVENMNLVNSEGSQMVYALMWSKGNQSPPLFFPFAGLKDTIGLIYYNRRYYRLDYVPVHASYDSLRGKLILDSGIVMKKSLLPFESFGITTFRKNNGDLWIILSFAHLQAGRLIDSFYVYSAFPNGLINSAKYGFPQGKSPLTYISSSRPILESSPNGKSFVHKNWVYGKDSNKTPWGAGQVSMYSFNPLTGVISSPHIVDEYKPNADGKNSIFKEVHSVAYSPNGKILYLSATQDSINSVFQYDLTASDISSTRTKLFNAFTIKRMPDGRILTCNPDVQPYTLGVIHQPDKKGKACNFDTAWLNTEVYHEWYPNIEPPMFYFPKTFDGYRRGIGHANGCDSFRIYNLFDTFFYKSFTWHLPSGDSIKEYLPDTLIHKSGRYRVKVKAEAANGYTAWAMDTFTYIKPLQASFSFESHEGCQWVGFRFKDESEFDTVKAGSELSFLWDFGDGTTDTARNPLHIYTTAGAFEVSLVVDNGFCRDTFTGIQNVKIIPAPKPGFAVSANKGCAPMKVDIKNLSPDVYEEIYYEIGNDSVIHAPYTSIILNTPGFYKIRQYLKGTTGCITSDSATVEVQRGYSNAVSMNVVNVSVVDNIIEIKWKRDSVAKEYRLYKKNKSEPEVQIAATSDTFYSDADVLTTEQSYLYYVYGLDSCDNLSSQGLPGSSILLHAQEEHNFMLLNWNAYSEWESGVAAYQIERRMPDGSWSALTSQPYLSFKDSSLPNQGEYSSCYRIVATSNDGFTSYSNTACADFKPVIYIPNAFSPNADGKNDFFEIITLGVTGGSIQIRSRDNAIVYESDDLFNFWDGKSKGKFVPAGVYVYYIKAEAKEGAINKKGTVTVIR